jgi:hypothetical protein
LFSLKFKKPVEYILHLLDASDLLPHSDFPRRAASIRVNPW